MLSRLSNLFCKEREESPVEQWALKNATRANPEQIIVAAIIESFAKDFTGWVGCGAIAGNAEEAWQTVGYSSGSGAYRTAVLSNTKAGVNIERGLTTQTKEYKTRYYYVRTKVNGVPISEREAQRMFRAYLSVKEGIENVKSAARRAKLSMEHNETAWNIAEKLLGMERNEQGALVPKGG